MEPRRTSLAFAIASALLVSAILPSSLSAAATEEPQELTPAERRAVAQAWVDALWSSYATGDTDLSGLTTAQGLEHLRAYDWRLRAVESSGIRFREEPELVDADTEWGAQEYAGAEQVRMGPELVIDFAPLAETYDAEVDEVLEVAAGEQRRVVGIGFRRAPGTDEWLVDEVGPLKGTSFRSMISLPAPATPCPVSRIPDVPPIPSWRLDPTRPPPGPESRKVHLKAGYIHRCHAGVLRGKPGIKMTETAVIIAIPMGQTFNSDACSGGEPARSTIRLPEPLGDRALYDARALPIRRIAHRSDRDELRGRQSPR